MVTLQSLANRDIWSPTQLLIPQFLPPRAIPFDQLHPFHPARPSASGSHQSAFCIYKFEGGYFLNLFLKYLFIGLCQVFLATCRIFSYGMRTLSCGMWDLIPWPWTEPGPSSLGVPNLSDWTCRELPGQGLFNWKRLTLKSRDVWFFFAKLCENIQTHSKVAILRTMNMCLLRFPACPNAANLLLNQSKVTLGLGWEEWREHSDTKLERHQK